MSFKIRYPSPAMAPYIKQYWTMNGLIKRGREHIQRVVPNGFAELIFYFNDIPANIDRPDSPAARSVISGQQSAYYDLRVSGTINLLSIMFTPHGAKQLFNIPISEIYNRNRPLRDLLGPLADQLEELLFDAPDLNSQVAIIEKYFLKQLIHRKEYEFRRIADSVATISRTRGAIEVEELAGRACLSRKQYERCFRELVGAGPKQFLRIIRFQNAINIKQTESSLSLTSLAHRAGYFDQSHLIKEFRAISGYSPGAYFAECDPVSDYFG